MRDKCQTNFYDCDSVTTIYPGTLHDTTIPSVTNCHRSTEQRQTNILGLERGIYSVLLWQLYPGGVSNMNALVAGKWQLYPAGVSNMNALVAGKWLLYTVALTLGYDSDHRVIQLLIFTVLYVTRPYTNKHSNVKESENA